jgi:hypothetical protein
MSFLGDLFGDGDFHILDPLDLRGEGAQKASRSAAAIQDRQFREGLAELRRQFDVAQGNIQPFMQAGLSALPILQQGSSVGGLDQLLGQIMDSEVFGELRSERERGVQGMLGAGGLTRSGRAIEEGANIGTDLALNLSQILTGNADRLATRGQNAAVGAGTQSANFANSAAGLLGQSGNALASGILGSQQAQAQGQQNIMGLAGLIASMFSSDPELKTNIKKIGEIGPLDLVTWEWKDEFEDTIVSKMPTVGFLSTQVREFYPDYVVEYGGYDAVNYGELIPELEKTWQ